MGNRSLTLIFLSQILAVWQVLRVFFINIYAALLLPTDVYGAFLDFDYAECWIRPQFDVTVDIRYAIAECQEEYFFARPCRI